MVEVSKKFHLAPISRPSQRTRRWRSRLIFQCQRVRGALVRSPIFTFVPPERKHSEGAIIIALAE